MPTVKSALAKKQRRETSPISDIENEQPHEMTEIRGRRDLGVRYRQVNDRIDSISSQLEQAFEARSRVAREIYDTLGAGPYSIGDKIFTIVKRERKGQEPLYFFRERKVPEEIMHLE